MKCDEEYIGESARTFDEKYKELLKMPSTFFGHQSGTVHNITFGDFSIVGRVGHNFASNIKESIYIRTDNPTLNRI